MTQMRLDDTDLTYDIDDAADTLRFSPVFDAGFVDAEPCVQAPRYVGQSVGHSARCRRRIRDTQQIIAGLCDAIASGWDVGPELAYAKRQLAMLERAS